MKTITFNLSGYPGRWTHQKYRGFFYEAILPEEPFAISINKNSINVISCGFGMRNLFVPLKIPHTVPDVGGKSLPVIGVGICENLLISVIEDASLKECEFVLHHDQGMTHVLLVEGDT